mgnify:CR=1 FL=1
MIIDAFTFFNEKELVQLRIKYLNDLVDYFIIVEANTTHIGKKKSWNFEKMKLKIRLEYSDKTPFFWAETFFQRPVENFLLA